MVSNKRGMTLMEIIVVMIIIGIAAAVTLPNFVVPMEQSHATYAQHNLLAIYTAQQNYKNNNGSYCTDTSAAQAGCAAADANCGDTLAALDCNLNLNTQDDGTYAYICSNATLTCTATRNGAAAPNTIVLTLNTAINVAGNINPACNLNNNWCPP